jgi:hypothetical protein
LQRLSFNAEAQEDRKHQQPKQANGCTPTRRKVIHHSDHAIWLTALLISGDLAKSWRRNRTNVPFPVFLWDFE